MKENSNEQELLETFLAQTLDKIKAYDLEIENLLNNKGFEPKPWGEKGVRPLGSKEERKVLLQNAKEDIKADAGVWVQDYMKNNPSKEKTELGQKALSLIYPEDSVQDKDPKVRTAEPTNRINSMQNRFIELTSRYQSAKGRDDKELENNPQEALSKTKQYLNAMKFNGYKENKDEITKEKPNRSKDMDRD